MQNGRLGSNSCLGIISRRELGGKGIELGHRTCAVRELADPQQCEPLTVVLGLVLPVDEGRQVGQNHVFGRAAKNVVDPAVMVAPQNLSRPPVVCQDGRRERSPGLCRNWHSEGELNGGTRQVVPNLPMPGSSKCQSWNEIGPKWRGCLLDLTNS